MEKWDKRFLDLADHIALWSKDSTQVGAIIVKDNRQVVGMGYNGFPRGVDDDPHRYANRPAKIAYVVHAEANAILNANSSVDGCTIYVNRFTCNECAKLIIQSGIKKIVTYEWDFMSNWANAFKCAEDMYLETGIEVIKYEQR